MHSYQAEGPVVASHASGAHFSSRTLDLQLPSLFRTSAWLEGLHVPPSKMNLGNMLNTKMPGAAALGRPMQYEMQQNMQPDLQQHYAPAPYLNGRIKSENSSERGVSPHTSEHSSRYSSQAPPNLPQYPPITNGMANGMRYPSPSHMQQSAMPMLNNAYMPNPQEQPMYHQQVPHDQQAPATNGRPSGETGPPKAFACSTCGKGFARRSDLARHGMICRSRHNFALR